MRHDATVVGEDRQVFLHVDGDGDRLAQLAGALRAAAHQRVLHVEAEVIDGGGNERAEADAFLDHLRRRLGRAFDRHAHRLVELVGADAGVVVVPLQELVPVRHALLLAAEHHAVDEGHRLAGIGEQPGGGVLRLAFGRIRLAAKVRISLEHHARIRIVLRQHIGAGAHRPPVEREIPLRHPRLVEELLRLPGNRREERHRQPVGELRIAAVQLDAVGVAVDPLHALESVLAQIQPRAGTIHTLEKLGIVGHADDVLRHQSAESANAAGDARGA